MAVINLFYSAVNITDYLIVTASKVSNPNVEEAREVYPPPHNVIVNAIIPSSGELDATNYYVRWYSSSDGETLDLLLAEFKYDAKNKKPISERRFYQVGGIRDIDPAPDQNLLIDDYLDGKNITEVHKQGYGPLAPPSEDFKEYDRPEGNTIELLHDQQFNEGEFISIEITYTQEYEDSASNNGFYNGTVLIESSMQLFDDHRNKRLKCVGSAATFVLRLEELSVVPDGRFYYITCTSGTQKEVRVMPFLGSGDQIMFEGELMDEVSVGMGEFARVEKSGTFWEIIVYHPNMSYVGERINKTVKNARNVIPEDPRVLHDGDVYARMWYWITTKLPSNHYVIDDNVINPGYVHPAGKEGMFVIHSSQRKFRTPNSQGKVIQGVDNYDNLTSHYPGTFRAGAVGEHRHLVFANNGTTNNKNALSDTNSPDRRQGAGTDVNNVNYEYSITGDSIDPTLGRTNKGKTMAGVDLPAKNTVDHIGEIFLRRT